MDDRGQIENMLARYSEYYDQGNLVAYSKLFEHGRTISPDGSMREGAEAVRKHHEELAHFYDGKPNTAHVISNVRIEIADDSQTAESCCYVTVFQAAPGFSLQPIFLGRYLDKFEKHDSAWRWIERRAINDLPGDLSHHVRAS